MTSLPRPSLGFRPSLSFVLLALLFTFLWVAGGASRADVIGQAVVRGAASMLVIVAILFGPRPSFGEAKPVVAFFTLALLLVLLQLMPLPPALWQALPGHAPLVDAASVSGQPQPWRPWTLVPGATLNALGSLIIPLVAMILMLKLKMAERANVPGILLIFAAASMMIGMLQFSGARFDNMFVNDAAGIASGTFANRNHFALLLAIGCVLAPVWAVATDKKFVWRGVLASGLIVLFLLALLATGSRAGLGLGAIGVLLGLLISGRAIRDRLRGYPRWVLPALITGALSVILVCVSLTVLLGRAESIDRMVATSQGQDMRVRGLPVVLEIVGEYSPMGSGLGSFDPVFRMHEPAELLKPSYFNHAHNDLLEVVFTSGVPGVLLLVLATGWWALASFRAWRGQPGRGGYLPKLGSSILLLVLLGSIFDYPARTPSIMAFIMVAAVWLSGPADSRFAALPRRRSHL